MITQENDESVLKKQKSDHKWLIIFLGKVCTRHLSLQEVIFVVEIPNVLTPSQVLRFFRQIQIDYQVWCRCISRRASTGETCSGP